MRSSTWKNASVLILLIIKYVQAQSHDQCTSIIVGKTGSANGAPMTTHTNDCSNCDFRLIKVPAMDHAPGAMVDIPLVKMDYPRYVGSARGPLFKPDQLDPALRSNFPNPTNLTVILGQIPQVSHTYAYLDGLYGIINEHQVAIGESTCGGRLVSKPLGIDGGKALFDVSALSRLALERTTSAREAIQLMGDLAVKYGYYGAEYEGMGALSEAGEALTVTDPNEAWMFHIHPDDTGSSAVWAAQRIPDGNVAAVANQFVIRHVNLTDTDNFMGSLNLKLVAERAGFISSVSNEEVLFDFTAAFALRQENGYHYYSTRRVWRVFQLANPTLSLSPYTKDVLASDYPFSVTPIQPLSTRDIMQFQRDHYEGTAFDMTSGPAGGPYGDPDRYDMSNQGNVSVAELKHLGGRFERAISIFRASYSFVSELSTATSKIWFGQYAPHATAYVPIYAQVSQTPVRLSSGSLFRYDPAASYWTHLIVGNWVARYYIHAISDVKHVQMILEESFAKKQQEVDQWIEDHHPNATIITAYLTQASADYAETVHNSFQNLFHHLVTKYHDGYHMEGLTSAVIQPQSFFYPIWWLKEVGFFHHQLNSDGDIHLHWALLLAMTVALGGLLIWIGISIGRRAEQNAQGYKYLPVN